MASLQHGNQSDYGRLRKRQKVDMACDQCRERKVKCDAGRPACQPCTNRQGNRSDCSYAQRNVRGQARSQEEISRLASRVRELEAEKIVASPSHGFPLSQQNDHQPQLSTAQEQPGLGAMIELGEDTHMTRDYEDSSAASFMNRLRAAIEQQVSPEAPTSPVSEVPNAKLSGQEPRRQSQQTLDYVLPPRKKADGLLRIYWDLVDPLYPFLERDDFEDLYQRLWAGNPLECDEATLLCLLNTIFSLACVLDPSTPPEHRQALADTFFARADHFISLELLHHQSLLIVQCFLILGQYLQSTNAPQKCWNFIGLAIRTAQTIGLHLPSTSAHARNAQETDLLRRVWHGCILMDRALSMTFGRPSMITTQAANSVPRPLPHKDIHNCDCTSDGFQSKEIPQDRHFFIESLRLYEILNDILLSVYTPLPEDVGVSDQNNALPQESSIARLSAVFRIDQDMRHFVRQLPRFLRFDCMESRTATHERQANVLWLRYQYIRILLLRNALTYTCVTPRSSSGSIDEVLPERVILQCGILCTELSIRIIEFFSERTKSDGGAGQLLDNILPAWWYTVLYIYTAATVLIAARTSTAITTALSQERLTGVLEEAIRLLKLFSRYSKNADRCAAAITILLDKLQVQRDQRGRFQAQHTNQSSQSQPVRSVDPSLVFSDQHWFSNMDHPAGPVFPDPQNQLVLDSTLDWSDMSWLSSVPIDLFNSH